MHIMVDTNILLSAALFPNKRINSIFEYIEREHTLVICDLVVEEFIEVAGYPKFNMTAAAQEFLRKLHFDEYKTPKVVPLKGISIRDNDDYDILFSAINSKVDVFLTGDKDFLESEVKTPKMMTLSQFEENYINN